MPERYAYFAQEGAFAPSTSRKDTTLAFQGEEDSPVAQLLKRELPEKLAGKLQERLGRESRPAPKRHFAHLMSDTPPLHRLDADLIQQNQNLQQEKGDN